MPFPSLKVLDKLCRKKRLLSFYSNTSAFSFQIALALIILVYSNCVAVTLLRWSTALLALPIKKRVCLIRERIWKTSTLSTSWESLEAARKPTNILHYLDSGSMTFITLDSIFCQLPYEIVCFSSPEMNLWSCQWQRKVTYSGTGYLSNIIVLRVSSLKKNYVKKGATKLFLIFVIFLTACVIFNIKPFINSVWWYIAYRFDFNTSFLLNTSGIWFFGPGTRLLENLG